MSYKDFIKIFPKYSFLETLFNKDQIVLKKWSSGEVIIKENTNLDYLYFFTNGYGHVSKLLNNGKVIVYDTYNSGSIAGDVEFLANIKTTCSLKSTHGLSGYRIPVTQLDINIKQHLFNKLAKEVSFKLVRASINNSLKLGYTLEERFAFYLIYDQPDMLLKMSELADLLGVTYRHLSRIINKFESEKIIKVEKNIIKILNKSELEKISETIAEDAFY